MTTISELSVRFWDEKEGTFEYRSCDDDYVPMIDLCSGIEDDCGDLIYEGDFLELDGGEVVLVYYQNAAFKVRHFCDDGGCGWDFLAEIENKHSTIHIVGNIRENPAFLKLAKG